MLLEELLCRPDFSWADRRSRMGARLQSFDNSSRVSSVFFGRHARYTRFDSVTPLPNLSLLGCAANCAFECPPQCAGNFAPGNSPDNCRG